MSKHLRFIEPFFTTANPSTNGLVGVARRLAEEGWDVEIWCCELDPSLVGKVRVNHIPRIPCPTFFSFFINFALVHLMALADLIRGNPKPDVTVATGFMLLPADYATVHFSHFNWLGQLLNIGIFSNRQVFTEFLKSWFGVFSEILLFYNPWPTTLLPVSQSVEADLRAWAAPWKKIHLLPNCIQTDRFTPKVRELHRTSARKTHGFGDQEIILAFAANGHFFRKNLFTAVAVTGMLRQRRHQAKLLVIGGREKTLAGQQRKLRQFIPGFEEWTRFTGQVDDMPYHFSAADAFFFPSHCEAFSLVEIEAASVGLPLLLTPHHGSEMILKDGINGRLLPWDLEGMADVIESAIRDGLQPVDPPYTGKAFTKEQYQQAWEKILK